MTVTPAKETFLDPALLARISDLPLIARTVVDGFMHGLHRSAKKGLSLDFAEHRQYQPGDDLRRIDWQWLLSWEYACQCEPSRQTEQPGQSGCG